MAHYAYLDDNNVVTLVIVGNDETIPPSNWEEYYGAKRTSYNTRGGVYYDPITNQPSQDQTKAFRKNYAGIGYMYDAIRDAFIPPKPFNSWVLDEQTCLWKAPVDMPEDAGTGDPPKRYQWDEVTTSWAEISQPEQP